MRDEFILLFRIVRSWVFIYPTAHFRTSCIRGSLLGAGIIIINKSDMCLPSDSLSLGVSERPKNLYGDKQENEIS